MSSSIDASETIRSTETPSDQRWRWTLGQIQRDLLLWVMLVILMQFARSVMMITFSGQWSPESGLVEYALVAARGFRYDVSIAMYLTLPCILASTACLFGDARRPAGVVRAIWAPIAVIVVTLLSVVDGVFFAEFHDQFNHFALGALQGYLGPVIETAWAEYPLGWLALGLLLALTACVLCLRWAFDWNWLNRPRLRHATRWPPLRIAIMVCFTGLIVVSLRGGVGNRPIQLKDSSATTDTELNKVVPNALFSLRCAAQQHWRLVSAEGLSAYLGDESIHDAASVVSDRGGVDSVDMATLRVAGGARVERPKHVFLVIMESADTWAMQPEFRSLHLSDELAALATGGLAADFFVAAGKGSIESVASILTGLPEVGVSTNFQPNSRSTYATSLAPQMAALGYEPRFYKGSFMVFQRYADFAREQGFARIEGAEVIRREDTPVNEWGVQDDVLFEHVASSLGDEPSFNVIVTTTYHPPYDLDVHDMGYPVETAPNDLPEPCETCTPKWLRTVGHAWFADRALGDFVRSVEAEHPDALFIVTGDHWSRRYPTHRPPLTVACQSPCVWYGPLAMEDLDRGSFYGSHLDIAPTLIELIAPRGHEYHSFGADMFDRDASTMFAAGAGVVVGPGFVHDPELGLVETWGNSPADETAVQQGSYWSRMVSGLGWWRIMRGNALGDHDGTDAPTSAASPYVNAAARTR
jgi:phosphoglycerol transferase MdoB-like AlkP superfamily enzyme